MEIQRNGVVRSARITKNIRAEVHNSILEEEQVATLEVDEQDGNADLSFQHDWKAKCTGE